MVKADGKPEGFHRGRWKPVNGPREGGGLMRSSLRPRVMCGIRDSSHKHMHTQYTHTQTHTRTRTHTHTHKYTHTHTPTPVARSCVCVAMSSLSLSKSLCISLSLGVPACVSGGSDALLAGADENSWQSRPRHACASSAFHTPSSRLHAPCAHSDLGCANYGAEALPTHPHGGQQCVRARKALLSREPRCSLGYLVKHAQRQPFSADRAQELGQ